LKNESVKRGEAPEYFISQASTILEYGKAIPMQSAVERRREQLDLPEILAPDVDEVQKLLKATKLAEKLPKKEE
jgi:hypothetical protein